MKLSPTRDLVIISAEKPQKKTASGFYISEEWKTLPHIGEVVAIGPGVTSVVVGDKVVFERYASVIMENDMRLCKESHVLAKIEDEDVQGS